MNPSTPTLNEVSNKFLEAQARASKDGTVEMNISNMTVYPFENRWWVRFTCGEPFDGGFARIPLGDSRSEAFDTLIELSPSTMPIEFDEFCMNTVTIDFDTKHITSGGEGREMKELENPVFLNDMRGHLSELPRKQEFDYDNRDDAEEIQSEIENELNLYHQIECCIENDSLVLIDSLTPISENEILLHLDVGCKITFDVKIELPYMNEITNHPVSEFVQSIGCGHINNIDGNEVYITTKDDERETIGSDTMFDEYVITIEQPKENTGVLNRLF